GAFVERALFLDQPDATRSWGELRAFQDQLIGRLSKASELHLEADGTDLKLEVKGRTWINSDGRRN
ncbi:MAG: aminopeptidase, partial [Actinobacteria bacterium]